MRSEGRVVHLEGSGEGSRRALCGAVGGRVRWRHELGDGDEVCAACVERRDELWPGRWPAPPRVEVLEGQGSLFGDDVL